MALGSNNGNYGGAAAQTRTSTLALIALIVRTIQAPVLLLVLRFFTPADDVGLTVFFSVADVVVVAPFAFAALCSCKTDSLIFVNIALSGCRYSMVNTLHSTLYINVNVRYLCLCIPYEIYMHIARPILFRRGCSFLSHSLLYIYYMCMYSRTTTPGRNNSRGTERERETERMWNRRRGQEEWAIARVCMYFIHE